MTKFRLFIALCLALLMGSTPLSAQSPQDAKQPQAAAAATTTATAKKPAATTTPATPATQEKQAAKSGGGKDSPFDYHASEEISEDLPVSFPVDI